MRRMRAHVRLQTTGVDTRGIHQRLIPDIDTRDRYQEPCPMTQFGRTIVKSFQTLSFQKARLHPARCVAQPNQAVASLITGAKIKDSRVRLRGVSRAGLRLCCGDALDPEGDALCCNRAREHRRGGVLEHALEEGTVAL
eukprot:5997332-Pleurochrysis_carterae.AAC.2